MVGAEIFSLDLENRAQCLPPCSLPAAGHLPPAIHELIQGEVIMKRVFVFDQDKCCACSACVIGCTDQNDIDIAGHEPCFRKTFDREITLADGSVYCAYISSACMHCSDAPCIVPVRLDVFAGMKIQGSQSTIIQIALDAKVRNGLPFWGPSVSGI